MHSENPHRSSPCRANDEFLRQLVGGELYKADRSCPHQNTAARIPACRRQAELCRRPQPRTPLCPPQPRREESPAPPCNEGDGCGVPTSHIYAPALAMVYSPVQGWEGVLDPVQALKNGSQFAALVLPLESDKDNHKCGRCQQ